MASHFFGIRVVAALSQAVLIAQLARYLGTTDFSAYATLMGVLMLASALGDLGLSTAVQRERARGADADALRGSSSLKLSVISSLATAAVTGTVVGISPWGSPVLAVAAGRLIATDILVNTANGVSMADSDVRRLQLTMVGRRILPLCAVFAALSGYRSALARCHIHPPRRWQRRATVFLYTSSAASVVRGGGSMFAAARSMRTSAPFYVHNVSMTLRQMDVLLVTAVSTQAAAVAYSAVSRLVQPLRMLPTSFAAVLSRTWPATDCPPARRSPRPVGCTP